MLKDPIILIRLKQWFKKSVQVWKSELIWITSLFVSACIFFMKVLLHPDQLFVSFDMVFQYYPWGFFAQSMLKNGQLPLWIPYTLGGEPFIANQQTAIFYPPNRILFSVLPAHLAFGYSYLLHIFFTGFFLYIFMRYLKLDRACSFLSSIIFMYSGFIVARTLAGHYTHISAICWLPLIFLLFDLALKQKSVFYGLLTGISIALLFLAGHMQYPLYILFALGLYLVYQVILSIKKKRTYKEVAKLLAISALAVVIGVLLAAIQLLPTFEFSELTTLAGGLVYDNVASFSFPRPNLITFVLPNFFGKMGSYWGYEEFSVYIGIFPLILIFFAIYFKRSNEYVMFFTGLAFLSLLLALGVNTPIYWVLWKYVPGFNLFRSPSRFNFLFTFSASILAGFGFNFIKSELTFHERKQVWKVIKRFFFAMLILMFVCGIELILTFRDQFIISSFDSIVSIIKHRFPIVVDFLIFLALSIGSVALLALQIKKINPFKFKVFNIIKDNLNFIVILFILSNLWFFHIGFIDTKNPKDIYHEHDYVVFLQNNLEYYRVYDVYGEYLKILRTYGVHDLGPGPLTRGIPDNSQIIYGIQELSSYNPLKLKAYKEVLSCIHNLSDNTNHPILNLLNVKYILTATQLNNSGFKLVFTQKEEQYHTYIYENEQVLPKAFVIHKVKLISKNDVIQELKSESFNPIDAIILEQKMNNEPLGNEQNEGFEKAEISKYSPNEIIVAANITQPGFLVLSENYYPGWKVYVDGVQQEIHKAYHTLRAVYLDAGLHNVRFTYDPASLRIGSWITFLTSIFLVISISVKIIIHLKLLRELQ